MSDTISEQRQEKDQLKKENEELKKKIAELEATQEEVDPEEKVMYTSDGGEMPIEEWKAREESFQFCYLLLQFILFLQLVLFASAQIVSLICDTSFCRMSLQFSLQRSFSSSF
jgi:hypothetical protein